MSKLIDFYADDEQPNACPYCSHRTELVKQYKDHSKERCERCDLQFNFWFDDEQSKTVGSSD